MKVGILFFSNAITPVIRTDWHLISVQWIDGMNEQMNE
jgi:hypothetical protein